MKEWGSFDKITKGKGVWLIDSKGNKMIDAVASMWCNVWGAFKPTTNYSHYRTNQETPAFVIV